MARFEPGKCLYCRCEFTKPVKRGRFNAPRSNDPTEDHVYPATVPLPPNLTHRNSRAGIVRCCWSCNNRKGGMHPLAWLSICPDPDGAQDFAKLLLKLGQTENSVQFALKRRERMA